MKTTALAIDLLSTDGGTQSRIGIDQEVLDEYVELIQSSEKWPFPPCDVFHDGTQHYVADGFHRVLAAARAKRGSIPCVVRKGSKWDALVFAMTANDRHGLRMTRDDKRHCVELLLDSGRKFTQSQIAEFAGVSKRTVQVIVAERNPASIAGKAQIAPEPTSGGDDSWRHTARPEPETQETPASKNDQPLSPESVPPSEKCPNCAGTRWDEDEDGWVCAKCSHPYGEPAGDVDDDRLATQRSKTVKTAEALMRCFDDLQVLKANALHSSVIPSCKGLIVAARGWK